MKKIYLALATGVAAFSAVAQQQLPNAGFEEGWKNCVPWTSDGNAKECTDYKSKELGQTPTDYTSEKKNWTISHVIGMNGLGATVVGGKTEGYNSASAVKVNNVPNSMMPTQKVPGYVTLGTPWSTAVGMGNNPDGGSFGGIQFTDRPESITFKYKRTRAEGSSSTEPATVVAYLWKGTFEQDNVPGNISFSVTKKTMVNRDRNIPDITR